MSRRSKNRLFSQFIRQLNDDLTVKTEGLTEESRLTNTSVDSKVDSAIADLISTAPETLNTLDELAAALGDDANFATTVTNSIATKANSADLATVATSGSYNDLSNKPSIPSISGLATTTYVDTAVAGAGSGDGFGTVTTTLSNHEVDLSTGTYFNINAQGASTVSFTNASGIMDFKLDIDPLSAVEGGYRSDGASTISGPRTATQMGLPESTGALTRGVAMSNDGRYFYAGQRQVVYQYELSTPWDLTTVNTTAVASLSTFYNNTQYVTSISFWDAGTKLAVVRSGSVLVFTLSTAWDISTTSTVSINLYNGFAGTTIQCAFANEDGDYFYTGSSVSANYGRLSIYQMGSNKLPTTYANRFAVEQYQGISFNAQITSGQISPDGEFLLLGYSNGAGQLRQCSTPFRPGSSGSTDITGPVYYNYGMHWTDNGTKLVRGGSHHANTQASYNIVQTTATVVQPSVTFPNHTVNGSVPALVSGTTRVINMITPDGGTTYEMINGEGGGGSGGGKVLGEYHAVCNGSALKDVTAQNVTAVQNLSTTYTDATGSVISGISVPSGTKKIIYQYNAMISWVDTHGISHWKLFFSTDGSSWTEVVDARRNPSTGQNADAHQSLTWPFEIAADTADNNSGKLTTTDTDTYYFKWQVREYSASNEMKLHTTQYWDGGSTDQFSVPTVSIKCLS